MTLDELMFVKGGNFCNVDSPPPYWIREIGPIGNNGFVGMYFWDPIGGSYYGLAGNKLTCVNGVLQMAN